MSRCHHYIIFPINKVLSAELSELKMYKPHPNEKLNKKTRPLSSKSLKKDSERETHEPPLRKKKGGCIYETQTYHNDSDPSPWNSQQFTPQSQEQNIQWYSDKF